MAKVQCNPQNDQNALTLPLMAALFYEPGFAASLKSKIGLTTIQIQRLKTAAHTSLRAMSEDCNINTASVRVTSQRYQAQIREIVGDDKARQLQQLLVDRYS